MPDTESLVPLAEIAGVFVGFGALIAVRRGGPTSPLEVAPMRMMVTMGMLAVAAGLAPGVLGRFGLGEHEVWAGSSAVVLIGWAVAVGASLRTPEYREGWRAEIDAATAGSRPRWLAVVENVPVALYMVVTLLTPVLILLGVVPDLEAAMYYAEVVLILIGAGWALLGLVFAPRAPEGG